MSTSNGSSHHAAKPFHNPRTLLSSVKYHVQHWVNLVIYNSIYQNLFLLYLYRIFKFLYGLLDRSTELSRICGANPGSSTPLDALWDEEGNLASPLVLDRQGGTIAYSCGLVSRRLAAVATARAKALSLAMGRRGSVQAGTATALSTNAGSSRDSSESSASTGSEGERQTLVGSTRTSISTKYSEEASLGAELHQKDSHMDGHLHLPQKQQQQQQLMTHRRTTSGSGNSNGRSKKRESSTSSSGSNESFGTAASAGGYAGVKMDLRQSRSAAGLIYRIDRCILFSKQLTVERRELEAADCDPEDVTQQILRKKRFPEGGSPYTPSAKKLQYAIDRIAASHQLAREINQRVHIKYDSTNTAHERKLMQLWDLLSPHEKLISRYTKQWTEIGFQGKDPATDFRGMGMLGLDDLVYYAKHYPISSKYTLECSHHETSWYSFAIVGINITAFAVQTLRTRQLQYYLFLNGAEISVYHEFYCYLFHRFNSYWSTLEPKPSIMDFERVFADFKVTMERQLSRRKLMMLKSDSKESYPALIAATVAATPVVRGRKISTGHKDRESIEMENRKTK